jgi:hypothetical protein
MATYVLVHGACHDGSAFDRDFFREMFINDADLETARRAYCRLSSLPFGQLQEHLDVKRFHTLEIPRSQMPGSHELMFSNRVGLAEKILEAGRD